VTYLKSTRYRKKRCISSIEETNLSLVLGWGTSAVFEAFAHFNDELNATNDVSSRLAKRNGVF
jgi:hypothetical protein